MQRVSGQKAVKIEQELRAEGSRAHGGETCRKERVQHSRLRNKHRKRCTHACRFKAHEEASDAVFFTWFVPQRRIYVTDDGEVGLV